MGPALHPSRIRLTGVRMQRIVDMMQRFGMLKTRFNVSQMIG